MKEKSQYLSVAIEAVKNAEKIIMHYFNGDLQTTTKADLTPVTIADKEAEQAIVDTIRKAFPDHTFYGEEGDRVDLNEHKGYTWVIDPIDGTKSYMRGNPLFGTQLALLKDGQLILGVSNAPAINELMYAEKGRGCFLNGKPVTVSKVDKLEEAYMSFGSLRLFDMEQLITGLVGLAKKVRWGRGIGDFWGYHLIAQGKIDIMIEPQIKFWDIAAVKVIVEEAGGEILQLDGGVITHHSTDTLATNGQLSKQVLNDLGVGSGRSGLVPLSE